MMLVALIVATAWPRAAVCAVNTFIPRCAIVYAPSTSKDTTRSLLIIDWVV